MIIFGRNFAITVIVLRLLSTGHPLASLGLYQSIARVPPPPTFTAVVVAPQPLSQNFKPGLIQKQRQNDIGVRSVQRVYRREAGLS